MMLREITLFIGSKIPAAITDSHHNSAPRIGGNRTTIFNGERITGTRRSMRIRKMHNGGTGSV